MKTNRRQFLQSASVGGAALAGLLPGLVARADESPKEPRIDFRYLANGLNFLGRVHHYQDNMSGHIGASLIAGYFFGEEHQDLDDEVYQGVETNLERIIHAGNPDQRRGGFTRAEMFLRFPKEKPDETLIDGIAEALEAGIDKPRQSGHNVIFASAAIRALKTHPEFATPSITDGIRKYILQFKSVNPGAGYYGKERGLIRNDQLGDDEAMFPPHQDLGGMAEAVIDALLKERTDYHRSGWGGLIHITNHAAGLVELARYGYRELAIKGLAAHHRHMRLWLSLPNVLGDPERGKPIDPGKHHPYTPAYWKPENINPGGGGLTHRVKTLYGFGELVELIKDEEKRKCADAKMHFVVQRW